MNKKQFSTASKIMQITEKLKVKKDGQNDFQKYNYFKPEAIMAALTPLLSEHKLFMKFDLVWSAEKDVYCGSLAFMDTEEIDTEPIIYAFDIPLTEVKGASAGQNAGATMTYCKRYMTMNAFDIADNKIDLDSMDQKNFKKAEPVGDLGECKMCGAANKLSRSGKKYCSALCWKQPAEAKAAATAKIAKIVAEAPPVEEMSF